MKKLVLILILLCLSGLVFAETADPTYRLGPGDKLKVGVWGHEDLQEELVVLPDGTIFFPLIGQIKIDGLTIPEAQQNIATELAVYVKDPKVSVIVVETRKIEIKVLGEVMKPGIYQMQPGSTVTDGIAIAGGPTKRAELSRVGVFEPNQPQPRLDISVGRKNKFNYVPGNTAPVLCDKDTIYVSETTSPNWDEIFPFISALADLKVLSR